MSSFAGYAYASAAAIMFGVQYLPVKKYEIFDGTTFQWFMCNGILLVGTALSVANCGLTPAGNIDLQVNLLCMLGGLLWALSNYLVIPLVKLLGIGLGFGLYHFVNLIVGYCVGRFGMFGLKKLDPHAQNGLLLCDIGCGILLVGFVLMVFVESTPDDSETGTVQLPPCIVEHTESDSDELERFREDYRRWRLGEAEGAKHPIGNFVVKAVGVKQHRAKRFLGFGLYEEPPADEALPFHKEFCRSQSEPPALTERLLDVSAEGLAAHPNSSCQQLMGVLLAVLAGTLCGLNNVPPSLYTQNHVDEGPFAPVFSQCLGIWITSTMIYVLYSSIARLVRWPVPHSVIRPALASGFIWATGFGCMLGGIKSLGYSVGYTLDAVGPVAVSSVISIAVYKEITGRRKLLLFLLSLACQVSGVAFIAFFGA